MRLNVAKVVDSRRELLGFVEMGGSAWDGKRMEEGWTGHVNPVSIQVIDTTPFVHRRGHYSS